MILKKPIRKNLSMMSFSLPYSLISRNYSSGAMKLEIQFAIGPALGSQ